MRFNMKTITLFLMVLFFFSACETGTRYEKNTTVNDTNTEEEDSIFVDRRINDLIDEDEKVAVEDVEYSDEPIEEEEVTHSDLQSFAGGVNRSGFDVRQIREGRHGDYVRLVFDIYQKNQPASNVGAYKAQYSASRDEIAVLLNGYQKFSAPLPSFSLSSPIEQIYFKTSVEKESYKFHIKLRQHAKVRVFALDNPARLVIDIKPI